MDVYLSEEARQHLQAQALESARRGARGLLLGHRRGGRFFVERIYPCSFGDFPSDRDYWALDGIFEGKIIGFYTGGRRAWPAGGKFPPFTFNKLCLKFDADPKKGLVLSPAVVEYSDSFKLVPVALAAQAKKKR